MNLIWLPATHQIPNKICCRWILVALCMPSCLVAIIILWVPPAHSQEPTFNLTLTLILNGRYLGDLSGNVTMDGYATIEHERLVKILARHLDESALISLKDSASPDGMFRISQSMTPPLDIRYAPDELAVHIQAPYQTFSTRTFSISDERQPDPRDYLETARVSGGLDFLYNQPYQHRSVDHNTGRAPGSAFLEVNGNFGGRNGINLLASGIYMEGAANGLQRREIRAYRDNPDTATRYAIGDISPIAQGFQQTPRLGGVSISRLYGEIQPYRNIRPSGRGEIVLDRASTIEVEVDGNIVRTEQLPAGRYDLIDFPLSIGSNAVRLLVEDDLGRREAKRFDPYHHPELLAPGLRQFDISIGRIEDIVPSGSLQYSDKNAFSGFVEQGWRESTTLTAGLQFNDVDFYSLDLGVRQGHRAGLTGLNLARSGFQSGEGESGHAAGLWHQWSRRPMAEYPISVSFYADYFEPTFSTLLSPGSETNRRLTTGVRSQFRVTQGWSAGIGIQRQGFHDNESIVRRDLSLSQNFSGRGSLFVGLSHVSGGNQSIEADRYSANLGISMRLGDRGLVRGQYFSQDSRSRIQAQRLGGRGIHDLSARAAVSKSPEIEELETGLFYRGNRSNLEIQSRGTTSSGIDSLDTSSSVLRVETGIAWADGQIGVAPRIGNGFAIYRPHDSLRGHALTITDSNGERVRGRSDFIGPPTIPLQRSYLPETLDTNVDRLPIGYDLGSQREHLLPGAFSGHIIQIGSDDFRTILGFLVDESGEPLPQLTGHLSRLSDDLLLPLFTNRAGRFVAERVPPGQYYVVLGDWVSVSPIQVTNESESLIDAGTLQMH